MAVRCGGAVAVWCSGGVVQCGGGVGCGMLAGCRWGVRVGCGARSCAPLPPSFASALPLPHPPASPHPHPPILTHTPPPPPASPHTHPPTHAATTCCARRGRCRAGDTDTGGHGAIGRASVWRAPASADRGSLAAVFRPPRSQASTLECAAALLSRGTRLCCSEELRRSAAHVDHGQNTLCSCRSSQRRSCMQTTRMRCVAICYSCRLSVAQSPSLTAKTCTGSAPWAVRWSCLLACARAWRLPSCAALRELTASPTCPGFRRRLA